MEVPCALLSGSPSVAANAGTGDCASGSTKSGAGEFCSVLTVRFTGLVEIRECSSSESLSESAVAGNVLMSRSSFVAPGENYDCTSLSCLTRLRLELLLVPLCINS